MPQKPTYGLTLENARTAQRREKAALAKLPKTSKRRSYFEQAVDYGEKSPKSKEEIQHDVNKSSYRRNTYAPLVNKLSGNNWKTEGIISDDKDLLDGVTNGYITLDEYNKANNLLSSRLVQAHKLKILKQDERGQSKIVSGSKFVNGRQYVPDEEESVIAWRRRQHRDTMGRKLSALNESDLARSNNEVGSILSGSVGAFAGIGLGALKTATKVGSSVIPGLDAVYRYTDDNERKYYESAEETGRPNMFLESMYGASAGTEQFLAAPATFGGEAGKYTLGRYMGQLQGMTPQQSDDIYDTLGMMKWYGERTGDTNNLTRQAIRLGTIEALTQTATLGAGLGAMNVAGSAFASALLPLTKNVIQYKAAQTVGSLIPGAASALGTAGIPGQIADRFGADEQTKQKINRGFEYAASPLEAVTENIPLIGKDEYGNPINYQEQDKQLKAQTDPYGVTGTLMTLGMFGSGTAGFYKDAKKLFQVSRMLAKANAAKPGKFAQAGMKLARQKGELIGAVGPDAAFALNNTFTPIAQSYRAATDNAVDENGNKIYNQPTVFDIARATVMTFGAVRPHAKLAPFIQTSFRGKPITGNADLNAQAFFIAKDFVDGGDWRASVINKRYKELTGNAEAHPDDIKRVVSEVYRRNKPVAMELLRNGNALPQHALESMFLGIGTGRGIDHSSSEVTQARVDDLIRNMRQKGNDEAHEDGNPLTSVQIDPNLYVMNPHARARQIKEVQSQILKDMQTSMAEAEQQKNVTPTDSVTQDVTSTAPKFFAVRIEDAADGTPQYIAYNSHRSATGHTFRSAELVRGDQDMSDLIDVSSAGHTASKRLFTAERLLDLLNQYPDVLNPITGNKWTTKDGAHTRTLAGFRPDGSVIVKQYNQATGETTEVTMSSVDVARELAEQNPRLASTLAPYLEQLNTNKTEVSELPDFYESQDFPDKVAYTAKDGQVREVNGRLISTFGSVNPLGIFQLTDGSVYVQPIKDSAVTTKKPMRSRDIDRSPETLNTRTLRQARSAVDNQSGSIDIDINNMGVPTRIILDQSHIELAEAILESDLPDEMKAEVLRSSIAEAIALDTAGEKLAYRVADDGNLVQDAEVKLGDVVVGNFSDDAQSGDSQRAVVIQTDGRMATVKLLTDPEGISYAVPVDQIVLEQHHDRDALQKRLNEFVPSEAYPVLRPWKRALSDEEELAIYITAKNAAAVQQQIRDASGEDLFDIVQKYVRDATSLPAAVKSGLISWAAINHDVERVLDTLVQLYDDAQNADTGSIIYMHRVASLYGDTAFLDSLYTIADLSDQISIQAQTSARSIQKTATIRAIARRMNQIIMRSGQPISVDNAYKKAITSLNIQPDATMEKDAKAEAHYMRGIAPHATPYIENMWQMRTMSGASLDMQVRLGRAIGAVAGENIRQALNDAGFSTRIDGFWTSKANYDYAVREIRNEIAKSIGQEGPSVEERLRGIGLDFLYYAAIDSTDGKIKNAVMADPVMYRDFQKKANNYVANVVLPKLILDAIGESVNEQTFLGSDLTGNTHETNKLSFLEVIASYGPDMEEIIDKSNIAEDSKIDLLGALRNLQEQIKTDGAAAKRVANYRGNNITGNHDIPLKDGDTTVNIPIVDSMIAIDEVTDEVINHAVVDNTVNQTSAKSDAGIFEATDELDLTTKSREETLRSARALVVDELRKSAHFAKVINYLRLFEIGNVDEHVNKYAGPELSEARAEAERLKELKRFGTVTQQQVNEAYAKYNEMRKDAFLRAFNFLDTIISAARSIDTLYAMGDADAFNIALGQLIDAYTDIKSVYTNPDARYLFGTTTSLSGAEILDGRAVAQSGEDGKVGQLGQSSTYAVDPAVQDLLDELYAQRNAINNDTRLSIKERTERLEEINAAIALYKSEIQQSKDTSETTDYNGTFISALNRFNKSVATLPDVLFDKYSNATEDMLAMQMVIQRDLIDALSKDWHGGIAGERARKYGYQTGADIKRVARVQENTMSFYSDIQKATDISISSEDGHVALTLFGQKHEVESTAEFHARIDRMNESRTKIDPNPSVDDAVFSANAIDADLAEFVGTDPAVTVHVVSSDNGFGGMAKNEDQAKAQSSIYAVHARNYAGLRKLLRQMLANEFGKTLESRSDDVTVMETDPQFTGIDQSMIVNPIRDTKLEDLTLTNPFVDMAFRSGWVPRLNNSTEIAKSRGITIDGVTHYATSSDKKALQNVATRISNYTENVTDGTIGQIAREIANIVRDEFSKSRPTAFAEAFVKTFNREAILNTWAKPDHTGRVGSWAKDTVDIPAQIVSTIRALEAHKTHAVAFNYGRTGVQSIFARPVADDLSSVSPATAKMMFDLYNSLELGNYNDELKQQIRDIKSAYALRMRVEDLKPAQAIARDAALIDRMATGLAKLYDNFAYGHANDRIQMLLSSSLGEHRSEIINGLRAVGVDETIVQRFIQESNKSFAEFLDSYASGTVKKSEIKDIVFPDDKLVAFRTYMLARGRQDYYMNSGRVLFTTEKVMGLTNVTMRRQTSDRGAIYGALSAFNSKTDRATHKLMMIGSDMNVYRSAATLAHEMSHSLFYGISDINQFNLLDALVGANADMLQKTEETQTHPLFPVLQQIQAAREYLSKNKTLNLQEAWAELKDVNGISLKDDWHPYAHEIFVSGFLSQITKFAMPIADNSALSIDYDAAAIFQEIAGPLQAVWKSLARDSPLDILRTVDGQYQQQWTSPIPMRTYTTGRKRTVQMPLLRMHDYVSFAVPNYGRTTGNPSAKMMTPYEMIEYWFNSNYGANNHQYGYQHTINGQTIYAPIQDTSVVEALAGLDVTPNSGDRYWVWPRTTADRINKKLGDEMSMFQSWGKRYSGRIVDQVVYVDGKLLRGQYTKAFTTYENLKPKDYVSQKENGGVDDNGFFTTQLMVEARSNKGTEETTGNTRVTTPIRDVMYVVEVPVSVMIQKKDGRLVSKPTVLRMMVNAEAFMDQDGTVGPRLHGYSGDFNPKFSAVLYDMNHKINAIQTAILNHQDYTDQVKLEKLLVGGTAADFARARPQTETATDRINAYFADQYKHVRAAGVDMRSMMNVGRASVEADLTDYLVDNGLVNEFGGLTDEGWNFIDSLRQNAFESMGAFMFNNGLFRSSLGRDMNSFGSSVKYDEAEGQYYLDRDTPEYQGLALFFEALENAFTIKNMDVDQRNQFAYDLFSAFSRPLDVAASTPKTRADRKLSAIDRINELFDAFNEGLPEESQINTSYIVQANEQNVASNIIDSLEFVMRGGQIGDFVTDINTTALMDVMDTIQSGQPYRFGAGYFETTGASYVLSRVRDVVFGRNNRLAYNNFIKAIASTDPAVREPAMQLMYATAHILDLQEREINSARYLWNSEFSLPINAFNKKGKVIIHHKSGTQFEVDMTNNQARPVVQDALNPMSYVYGDVLGKRYPVTDTESRNRFIYADSVDPRKINISQLRPIEAQIFARDGEVTFIRNRAMHDSSLPDGFYVYRIMTPRKAKQSNSKRYKDIDPLTVPYVVELRTNPYKSMVVDQNTGLRTNVQEYRQQSASHLIELAANAFFNDGSPETHQRIEQLRKNAIVPREIYIAKMLVAQQQHNDSSLIPEAWRKDMGQKYRVNEITHPLENETIKVTQSATINNSRKGTWLSSGEIPESDVRPWNDYEMSILDALEDFDPAYANDPEAVENFRQQRYSDMADFMSIAETPERLIIKHDTDNNQIGVALDGKDLYMSVPESDYNDVMTWLYSAAPSPRPHPKVTPQMMHALRFAHIPGKNKFMRAASILLTEALSIRNTSLLSRDFARPFIQNFLLSLTPKNFAMQFYGLAALMPNGFDFRNMRFVGNSFMTKMASGLLGHKQQTAYGDKAYHRVIDGLFAKYGTPGSSIGIGIPFVHRRSVKGKYEKPLISGMPPGRRAYTIADLNDLGLSTQYGEWFEAASAMKALNPSLDMKDIPIQLSQSEYVGKGVLAQRIPFVGMSERAGVCSTDILRIKEMLEYCAMVDDNLAAFGSAGATAAQMEYQATLAKRAMARLLNTQSGTPTGNDPFLHPKLQETYHVASMIYTAPNWTTALQNLAIFPAAIKLGVAVAVNEALRPIVRRMNNGIGYNIVDAGPQARFFNDLIFSTTTRGVGLHTPGARHAWTMAKAFAVVAALHNILNSAYVQQTKAALEARVSPHVARYTQWVTAKDLISQSETQEPIKVQDQKFFTTDRNWGKVSTVGDSQFNYPAAVMGFHKYFTLPIYEINDKLKEGQSMTSAIASTMLDYGFIKRLNPLFGDVMSQVTGSQFFGEASAQQHTGWTYYLANEKAIDREIWGTPLWFELQTAKLFHRNGMSRFAANQQNIQVQSLLKDLENMQYQRDQTKNKTFDPNTYNLKLSIFGRLVGIENRYHNSFLDELAQKKVGDKYTLGQYASEVRKYKYDYPNAFDMFSNYGLTSLATGIPGSGNVENNQEIPLPLMPTKEVINMSKNQEERLNKRIVGKITPTVKPFDKDLTKKLNDITERRRRQRELEEDEY